MSSNSIPNMRWSLGETVRSGAPERVDKDVVRTMGGGFGLTKAYYVVNELNGDMWIDSEAGEGTKIKVEIPIPELIGE